MISTDNHIKSAFIEGAAKAFFADAFASLYEEWCSSGEEIPDIFDGHVPGPGSDWMDYIPEVPTACYVEAGMLWEKIANLNNSNMYHIVTRALEAADIPTDPEEIELFGHYMAMQAMGHGVSWFDDHPEFQVGYDADKKDFSVPYHEYTFCNLPVEFPLPLPQD